MKTPSLQSFGASSDLIEDLLRARGITSAEEADAFLNPDYEEHLHAPALFSDMERAVARILSALSKNERIAVYADFDSDGIPAAVVLHDFFCKIGYENFEVYIPHRHNEGYGLHSEALGKIAKRGATLLVTVDVGIAAAEAVHTARTLGIDVIITDHHEIPAQVPDAYAIVHPQFVRDGGASIAYPFPHICGAAVAFKLVQALLMSPAHSLSGDEEKTVREKYNIKKGWEKWLLDMVGIATIADMVPLVGENRVLAHYGLAVLRKSPRPGLLALFRKMRISQANVTEDDIGFSIAPRINAASRMGVPELAFRLLSTRDVGEAEALVSEIEHLNHQRKGAVASTVKEVNKRIKERLPALSGAVESPVVVLGDPKWQPALLGLAANSVLEARGGIVCLWGRDGAGRLKGSCRSDGGVSVVELFKGAADVLEEFGGHHASGGFAVSHERVHELHEVFAREYPLAEMNLVESAERVEADLTLDVVNANFYRELSKMAPFGMGNAKPVFRFQGVRIEDVRIFGKGNEHMEIQFTSDAGARAKGVRFFASRNSFSANPEKGEVVHVLGSIERSVFGGRVEMRMRIVDILSCS